MRRAVIAAGHACSSHTRRCRDFADPQLFVESFQRFSASRSRHVFAASNLHQCPSQLYSASQSRPGLESVGATATLPLERSSLALSHSPSHAPAHALSPVKRSSLVTAPSPSVHVGSSLWPRSLHAQVFSAARAHTSGQLNVSAVANTADVTVAEASSPSAPREGFALSFLGQWRKENAAEIGYRVAEPASARFRGGAAGGAAQEGGSDVSEAAGVEIKELDAFAVVQVGSHQFKVTPGDAIYVEKLNFAHVNDVIHLEKVLLIGSPSESLIGRPTLPGAFVSALVEEHALDAKVIVFKKKRRKNYRRTNGHRQELTRLRILEIAGMDAAEERAIEAVA